MAKHSLKAQALSATALLSDWGGVRFWTFRIAGWGLICVRAPLRCRRTAYQGARNPWSQASPGYGAAIAALSQAIGNLIGKKWQQVAERSGLHDQFSRSCYLPAVRHPGGRRDVRQGERIAARAPLRRPPYPSSPANRVLVMPLQAARHANLCAVVRLLEQDGLVTREAQVQFLGNPVTAFKLQAMLDGGWIGPLFAERVEHVLLKPRGWMSEVHAEEATQAAETGPLVPS